MKFVVASAILYSCIAAPVLVAMSRTFEAGVHLVALALAYHWWIEQ